MGRPLGSQEKWDSVAQGISDAASQRNASFSAMKPGLSLTVSAPEMGQVLCHLYRKDFWTVSDQYFCD